MTKAVMPALVAGIHAGPFRARFPALPRGWAWMAGTSPAMTEEACSA
jgi:hypothetical protein